MSLQVKKGDNVIVLVGTEKGKEGKIIGVDRESGFVKVEGLNMVTRHRKARSAKETAGIIKMEGNIHVSNVQLVCPACNKPTRIGTMEVDGKKHRQCKKCAADMDLTKKAETPKKSTKSSSSKVKRTRKAKPEGEVSATPESADKE